MFGRDAHISAYQRHLVCLHALNLLFVLYYHRVYESGRSGETMILGPAFNHKKFSYLCMILLLVL
jgi:hypothetical protein